MIRKILILPALIAAGLAVTGLAAPAQARDVRLPVLDTLVRQGDVISRADLAWITIDDSQLYDGVITREDDIIGQTVRHPLPVRKPVRYMDLQRPQAVKKNGMVTISYRTGAMQLSTIGRALDNGGIDDMIDVQNPQSRQVVHGRVAGPNLVEVSPPNMAAN